VQERPAALPQAYARPKIGPVGWLLIGGLGFFGTVVTTTFGVIVIREAVANPPAITPRWLSRRLVGLDAATAGGRRTRDLGAGLAVPF
jgi:hypothetical protein